MSTKKSTSRRFAVPDKTYVVDDEQLDVGTEAAHQERYRQGLVTYMATLDGRLIKPRYFPIHKGQKGSDPAFSDSAHHVVTCTAVDADGTAHMLCACGLRYSIPAGPVLPGRPAAERT